MQKNADADRSARVVTVRSLKEAGSVGLDVHHVMVHEDGRPPIALARRIVGNDVQGFVGHDSRIGANIRVPQTAVIARGSVVDGDIHIGDGVILENAKITGAGRIRPFQHIRHEDTIAAGREVEIPLRELRREVRADPTAP